MTVLKRDFALEDFVLVNFINLTDEEMEMVRNWRNNENIRKLMYSDHIISLEEHSNFIYKLKEDNKSFYWIVKKNREYIGTISLNRVDFKNKNAYLGIYSNPDNKYQGAGNMLIKCLKNLVFDEINLHTLKLEVIENNERAINFYKKSGFRIEGKLKEFVFKNGKWHDIIVMGIIKRNGI